MAIITITPDEGWEGLADALTRAQPGDEFQLQAGEYFAETALILPAGVRLSGNGTVDIRVLASCAIIINHYDTEVSGLNFICPQQIFTQSLIHIRGANRIVIKNCEAIGNIPHPINKIPSPQYGIISIQSHNITVTNCIVRFCRWGIAFVDSDGFIKNNDCYNNLYQGIYVESHKPDHFAEITYIDSNSCHENGQSGIKVFRRVPNGGAKFAQADNNEFWGNSSLGISLGTQPSNIHPITPISNRCHHNKGGGFAIDETTNLEGNEQWGFGNQPKVSYALAPIWSSPPNWSASPTNSNSEHDQALTDFIVSAGCPDCFKSFWHWHTPSGTQQPAITASNQTRSHLYRVRPTSAKPSEVEIVAIPSNDPVLNGIDRQLSASRAKFNALLPAFARQCAIEDSYPFWNMALVSSNEVEFEQWLQDDTEIGKTRIDALTSGMLHPPQIQKQIIDFTGYGNAPDSPFLETALLKKKIDTWRGKIRERGKALASLLPMVEFVLLLSLLVLFGEIAKYFNLWKELIGLTLAVTILILLLIVANRHLPVPLRFSKALFRLLIFDTLKDLAEKLPKYLPKWLLCSEYSRRNWLKRELFGYRWFGKGKKADGYIVVIRNVDITSEAHRRELRLVAELCPRKTGLLLVTQLPGTSMLTGGFLDVWFPKNAPDEPQTGTSRIAAMQTYVVHDVSSASITSDDVSASPDKDDDVVGSLQPMLGWARDIKTTKEAQDAAYTAVKTLLDDHWTLGDFLPTLVLGSTPHMYMRAERADLDEGEDLIVDEFLKQIEPYQRIFSGETKTVTETGILNAEARAENAKALYVYVRDRKHRYHYWGGRVGYRRQLARQLRRLFLAMDKTADEANCYLCKLLACAEWHHVHQTVSLLESIDPKDTDLQKLPLHMEAALFLLRERQQLTPNGALERFDDLTDIWSELSGRLRQPKPAGVTTHQIERLCVAYTATMSQYCPTKIDDDPLADAWTPLQQLLEQAIDHPALDSAAQGCWGLFVGTVVTTVRKLAILPLSMGKELLAAKLSQEWHELPDSYRSKLHETLDQMPALLVDNIGKAETAESLLESAFELTLRPSLLIYCLGRLAGGGARESQLSASSEQKKNTLAEIASAVWQLTQAVAADGVIDQAEELPPMSASRAAQRAALALLTDPQSVAQLAGRLREMSNASAALSERTSRTRCELEGVSLGTHGMLNGVLKSVEECRLLIPVDDA